ncbi:MAG: hypothetical protein K8R54_18405 [Bacteroidales bacterium]|nr:hypothetical protein [Bacteroidales bacterium]
MLDTTDEIIQKQRKIIFSKTASERFIIGVELINFGRIVVESNIKQVTPDISEIDLKIAVFKRYYKNFFSNEELKKIINSMKNYYKDKKSLSNFYNSYNFK